MLAISCSPSPFQANNLLLFEIDLALYFISVAGKETRNFPPQEELVQYKNTCNKQYQNRRKNSFKGSSYCVSLYRNRFVITD